MSTNDQVTVLVVDDQQVVREGLVALLELVDGIEVVGSAVNGEQAVEAVDRHRPDVVLMDLGMPVLDGIEATKRIRRHYPHVAVLVLTTYADDESIAAALRAGARGYLTKDAGRREIGAALRSAAAGQSTFDATVSARLIAAISGAAISGAPGAAHSTAAGAPTQLPDGLTAREAQVLGLIGRGEPNAAIAAALFIGEATVKTHINNAFAKIGARNRADAVRYAIDHNLS